MCSLSHINENSYRKTTTLSDLRALLQVGDVGKTRSVNSLDQSEEEAGWQVAGSRSSKSKKNDSLSEEDTQRTIYSDLAVQKPSAVHNAGADTSRLTVSTSSEDVLDTWRGLRSSSVSEFTGCDARMAVSLLQENHWNVESAVNQFFEIGMGKVRGTSGPGVIGVPGAGGISGGMSRSQQAVEQSNSFVSGPGQPNMAQVSIPNEQEIRMMRRNQVNMPQMPAEYDMQPQAPEQQQQVGDDTKYNMYHQQQMYLNMQQMGATGAAASKGLGGAQTMQGMMGQDQMTQQLTQQQQLAGWQQNAMMNPMGWGQMGG